MSDKRQDELIGELRERMARVETKVDGLSEKLDVSISLVQEHMRGDAQQVQELVKGQAELRGFLKIAAYIGGGLVGLSAILLAVKELFF